MILIKDGRVVDPKRGIDDVLDLLIEDGKIKKIGKYQRSDDYERIVEAKGLIVAPGLIDVHVHFRDPGFEYKEDIVSGSRAAARGGYTTVICMATTLHSIATGNMTPSYRVLADGTIRPVYFYSVDISEFSVNKLRDRGSLGVKTIVTNVQDFVVNISKGLGL